MNEFQELGFFVYRNLYDVKNHTTEINDLYQYTKDTKLTSDFYGDKRDDVQCPEAPYFYRDKEMNKVQIKILNKLEKQTGLKLYPTYNYYRIYNDKSILKPHTDRPACEISVTMNIGYDGDYSWPIWLKGNDQKNYEVTLEPGDGLLYHGCTNLHWRKNADYRVKEQSQVFLHYVDQNGPFTDCIFDLIRLDFR